MLNQKKIIAGVITGSLLWNSSYAAVHEVTDKTVTPATINVQELLGDQSDLRGEITQGLEDQKVLAELGKLGVDKNEVKLRLAAMSDQELNQISQGLQRQVGGDVVVISITTLLLGIIILLLLVR